MKLTKIQKEIYAAIKLVLLRFYALDTVKQILRLNPRMKPNYEVMTACFYEAGVPYEAWKNIRLWLSEQEAKKAKK
nr:MAG TPA: hypothetical protein [Caudoviricetes sp.]